MNQPELFSNVVEISKSAIGRVDQSMLDLATPCTEWNVRQLINHMAITCRYSAAIMNEQPPSEDRLADTDVLGDDFAANYGTYADAAVAAFAADGAMERVIESPPGQVPGAFWADFPTWDLYVHTWDLTRAIGVAMDERPELSSQILAWGQRMFSGPRDPSQLGEMQDVADDAPAIEQLVGLFGRDPHARTSA